ncbi:MAG: ABC transporter permease [Defluviitaleaceae bacterium]|nr:ABC transporter permease [Defluviitaleaceae bacterium]
MKYIKKIHHLPVSIILSGLFLIIISLWVIIPNIIVPNALAQNLANSNLPAGSPGHILGTDVLGRDVLSMLIAGSRSALTGPIAIASGSFIIGLLLGSIAGWYGGFIDRVISAYADLTLSMPSMLLAIVAAGIIGGGYWVSVAVMIILYSPFDIRLVRSAVIVQKSKPYIESALILKIKTLRILSRHIFPNIAMLVMVNFFLNIAFGLVSMSSLSFLGLGVGPGEADWGRLLADGRQVLFTAPAQAVGAGILIILSAVAINLIGNFAMEKGDFDES